MPSHKEILQKRVAETERCYLEADREIGRLTKEIAAERETIARIEAQYEEQCRLLAQGADANPAASLAEKDRRSHRMHGLEILLQAATAAFEPLHAQHHEAQSALQMHLEAEERERLESAIADANKKRDIAQAAFKEAEQALAMVVRARTQFLRQLELKAQGRA